MAGHRRALPAPHRIVSTCAAPSHDGEYRPLLDYLSDDRRRPVKVHIFQDRGGCSYFQVGLRFQLAVIDDKLTVDIRDRYVEAASASTPLELALWLKQLIQGSVDRSTAPPRTPSSASAAAASRPACSAPSSRTTTSACASISRRADDVHGGVLA